jgi:3-oxoacyl-[acyl-carrier-protein] synthase-3
MKQIRPGIVGLGLALPPKILTNDDLAKFVDTNDEWITTRTGIKQRHVADETISTSDLAFEAAQAALKQAGLTAKDLDLIIVATSTPDFPLFPSTAAILQDRLGANKVGAFDLSAACSGFTYGLSNAQAFINSGMYKTILLVGAETLSKFVDWKDRRTCVLFGDGAGAAVIKAVDDGTGILYSMLGSDGKDGHFLSVKKGGSRHPLKNEALDDPDRFIFMDGKEVFKFGVKIIETCIEDVLQKNNLTPADIAYVVPHQANIRIIDAAARRFNWPSEKVYANISRFGNTSAATIPIALAEMQNRAMLKKGDLIITVGFGAGLTWAANLIKWSI